MYPSADALLVRWFVLLFGLIAVYRAYVGGRAAAFVGATTA
jgi:hypothetical protein